MNADTSIIPRGQDFLTTVRSDQYIELSAELLGPRMQPFAETVTLVGVDLDPGVGNTDTIMERLEDGALGARIPTRLVAFANVSAAPIKLEGKGAMAGYYDLYATLSPTAESPGYSVYKSDDGESGTFESVATFWPQFELRPLGGGDSLFIDSGVLPVPGFPMTIGSAGGHWARKPPYPNAARGFRSRGIFYHDEVIITATRAGQSARVAMVGAGDTIAKCAKIQAEFLREGELSRLGRLNFGIPARYTNLEL
jgi:hypothetical protein